MLSLSGQYWSDFLLPPSTSSVSITIVWIWKQKVTRMQRIKNLLQKLLHYIFVNDQLPEVFKRVRSGGWSSNELLVKSIELYQGGIDVSGWRLAWLFGQSDQVVVKWNWKWFYLLLRLCYLFKVLPISLYLLCCIFSCAILVGKA